MSLLYFDNVLKSFDPANSGRILLADPLNETRIYR